MHDLDVARGAQAWGDLGHALRRAARDDAEAHRSPRSTAIALGGGCELALACDLRLASSTAQARPARGQPRGPPRLGRQQSGSRARRRSDSPRTSVFTGRIVDADEALAHGLVNAVHPARRAHGAGRSSSAEALAAKSPLALAYAKEASNLALQGDHARTSRPRRASSRALLDARTRRKAWPRSSRSARPSSPGR